MDRDQQQRLHPRFTEEGQAPYAPQPQGAFTPFDRANANPNPNPAPDGFPPTPALPVPVPIYDSASALRGPWAPVPAPPSTSAGPSASPLRAVPGQVRLADRDRDRQSPEALPARALASLALDEDDSSAEDEMRRSRASPGSRSERQVPPRRMQEHQQRQLQRQQSTAAALAQPTQLTYGSIGANTPQDPYGRSQAAAAAAGGFGMPTVYGQQPAPLSYNPRGYSPSYPSPMQVMMGGVGVGVSVPGQYGAYGAYGQPELMTSPVAFGNPPPFSFQRISPDPAPSYPPPRAPGGPRPPYPPSSFHFNSPPPSSPPPPGARPLQPQQAYAPMGYSTPSGSSMQGYSPVFGVPTSPVFTQPRFANTGFAQPYGSQSPEDALRQSGGTWYFIPDQSGQAGGFEQVQHPHQHQHQQVPHHQHQQQYAQPYGLGFAPPQVARSESDSFPQAPISPIMYPIGGAPRPLRASHGHGPRPSLSQSSSTPSTNVPETGPSEPHARSDPATLRQSTSARGASADAADTSFGSQVSQIPFPSLSSPAQQSRPQRRPASPTRKAYHPNPPANRSEWVMWVGNVPHDATHDELWRYFNQPIPPQPYGPPLPGQPPAPGEDQSGGVSSVFLISRSNCAFVNFNSENHLERAVAFFNNKPIRPNDPRCPRLVCRVRRRDDDLRAGVGGQRGMGMHTRWVKEQRERDRDEQEQTPATAAAQVAEGKQPEQGAESDQPPDTPTRQKTLGHQGSSGSFTSTNSSFLQKYFPKRYFILKSLTQFDLNLSVERGLWATQPHNEPVLDQAFRTSTDVYLIFGANKSGEFYGYARMAGPIQYPGKQEKAENRVSWASRTESSHSSSKSIEGPLNKRQGQPEMIAEDQEGEHREEKRESRDEPAEPAQETGAAEETAAVHEEHDAAEEAQERPEPPSLEVSAPEEEDPEPKDHGGGLSERRDDVPGPMELPSSFLDPPAGGPSLASSPQPMTQDESQSLEERDPKEQRPLHHPHIRGGVRSQRQSPLPTPSVPTGDDAPRLPVPEEVASAPAEVGPERKRFTFDEPGPHNTIDGSDLRSSNNRTRLAAALASQPADLDLRLEAILSAADKQAERGASNQEGEVDGDGVMRRDTAPTEAEKLEHAQRTAAAEELTPEAGRPQMQSYTSGPTETTVVPEHEGATQPSEGVQSPEAEGGKPTGKEEESWGTPFKIEWIKVEPLPFYRARHLRNPWNNDREVKVSRDGTEIEPAVGARLLQEWERLEEDPTPAPPATGRNRGSRPPFRTGYSTPSAQIAAMQSPPVPLSPTQLDAMQSPTVPIPPYMPPRDNSGNVPQWLFQGRGPAPWQS